MALPISLHGNEYYEHLQQFRDSALVASHWFGQRRKIGALAFGTAHAEWQTEDGSSAHLIDTGLRLPATTLFPPLPTTLRIFNSPEEKGFEVVTFRMDIDDTGHIEVYRNLLSTGSFMSIARAELFKHTDRQHNLHRPSNEDREFLYTEMQRGASGLYPIEQQPEESE